MAKVDGSGAGQWSLKQLVTEWAALDEAIKAFADDPLAAPTGDFAGMSLDDMRKRRREMANRVVNRVEKDPDKWDAAVSFGFNEAILDTRADTSDPTPGSSGDRKPGEGSVYDDIDDAKDGKKDKDKGGKGGGTTPKNPDIGGDQLPGAKGKGYQVVRFGGETYVLYEYTIGNVTVRQRYRVKPNDLKNEVHGFGPGEGRVITKAELKRYQNWGTTDEIVRKKGGNKHPFPKFIKLLVEQHPGASWLKSKEVLGYMIQAHVENRGSEWLDNMLRTTKWWNKRTDDEREWELRLGDAEKQKRKDQAFNLLSDQIDNLFGPNVKWQDHISREQAENWATKIARGQVDSSGFLIKATSIAEGIEGTTAWAARHQTGQDNAAEVNEPEEMFERVRQQAINFLGYRGKPAQDALKKWAADLVSGVKSQADYDQYLRQTKKALYPYLAPDETWMDRAASYKNVAERVFGTDIGYDDKVLADFSALDANGKQTGTAMSLYEYEKFLRKNDGRFWQGPTAKEEGFGLLNALNQMFTGTPGSI